MKTGLTNITTYTCTYKMNFVIFWEVSLMHDWFVRAQSQKAVTSDWWYDHLIPVCHLLPNRRDLKWVTVHERPSPECCTETD